MSNGSFFEKKSVAHKNIAKIALNWIIIRRTEDLVQIDTVKEEP